VHAETPWLDRGAGVAGWAPSRRVVYVAALAFAFNYDMWNGLATQLCFFATLFILLHDAGRSGRPAARRALGLLAGLFVVTQASFLVFGGRMVRNWDVTEYKELLLPLAAAVHAFELAHRARALAAGRVGDAPAAARAP
jgi:hypothetical protein